MPLKPEFYMIIGYLKCNSMEDKLYADDFELVQSLIRFLLHCFGNQIL